MSSAVNGLTNSPTILHVTQRDFFRQNILHRTNKYVVQLCLPCYLEKGPLKQDFLNVYLTTSLGVRQFKNTWAMRVIFFRKCSKLNLNLENAEEKKKSENIFGFWDNCMWKYCYKLSLLRRKSLLSVVSGLTNSPNILQITQRDLFKPNCLHRDQ